MPELTLLISLAVSVAAIVLFFLATRFDTAAGRALFEVPSRGVASPETRSAVRAKLATKYALLTHENGETAAFLLDEAKTSFDTTRDAIKVLDGKAGTLIGLISTGLAAVSVFGDYTKLPAKTPYLYIALALFGVALLGAVLALPTRPLFEPRLSNYSLLSIAGDNDMKPRVQFELAESWLQAKQRAVAVGAGKARLVVWSSFALVMAVLCLCVNWIIGIQAACVSCAKP
jgi:hypothetical protein